jgi:hypothetical protein
MLHFYHCKSMLPSLSLVFFLLLHACDDQTNSQSVEDLSTNTDQAITDQAITDQAITDQAITDQMPPQLPLQYIHLFSALDAQSLEFFVEDLKSDSLIIDLNAGLDNPKEKAALALSMQDNTAQHLWIVLQPDDLLCEDCYTLKKEDQIAVIEYRQPLGAIYGLTDTLEHFDFRFYHPFEYFSPIKVQRALDFSLLAQFPRQSSHQPRIALRGLHLHTLHPIEALWAFVVTGEDHLLRAKQIIRWAVRQRCNYIQHSLLDELMNEEKRMLWQSHYRKIVDFAHHIGMKVGVNLQLFGKSNLQQAFDLLDELNLDLATKTEQIRTKLSILTALNIDRYNLSFGEFFSVDPQVFVDDLNLTLEQLLLLAPEAEVSTTIHVGNLEDLRIEFMNEPLLYYFLVKFADPRIIPWIHSVMYFNLFEPSNGAYLHTAFDEHREFLFEQINAGRKTGYHPESAYWVAFDNSVPVWLPVYVNSRLFDIDRIEQGVYPLALDEHVLFSTGWEWGYWQNDYATLRASYEKANHTQSVWEDMLKPLDPEAQGLGKLIFDIAERLHQALIHQPLSAFLAGRDAVIDAGEQAFHIIAAPTRPFYDDLTALSDLERQSFRETYLDPLQALLVELRLKKQALIQLGLNGSWFDEIKDGLEMLLLRVEHIESIYRFILEHPSLNDQNQEAFMRVKQRIEEILAEGEAIVVHRHGRLHDRLALNEQSIFNQRVINPTIYDYGYLFFNQKLCYWNRELQLMYKYYRLRSVIEPCF